MYPSVGAPADPIGGSAGAGRRLRVLILTSSFPRHPGDLAGVFVAEQAHALAADGFSVTVLAPGGGGLPPERWEGRLRVLRPRLTPLGFGDRLFYGAGVADNLVACPARLLALPVALAAFARHALRLARGADVVLSHWLLPSGLIGAAVSARAGVGHVAIAHSGGVHVLARLPRPLGSATARAIIGTAERVFCAGPHLAERLLDLAGPTAADRLAVLPVGLHTERYRRSGPFEPPAPGASLDVLCVARLVPVKGVDTLVAAVGARPPGPDRLPLRVTVVGDGPERPRLEAAVATARAPVRFVGAVPTDRLPELLRSCHVLAVPSRILPSGRTEGTPRVLLEALAAGTPIVATAVGGAPALLANGGGVLVPPDDPEALGTALDRLAAAPEFLRALANEAARRGAAHDWSRLVPPVAAALRAAAAAAPKASGQETTRPGPFSA